jgi:SAM-dependent methyltransferase
MPPPLTCAICGSAETEPIVEKFGYPIVRCRSCGLVYASPRMPTAAILARYSPDYFWNEYLPSYGVREGLVDLEHFDRRYRDMLALIRANVSATGRMLEIGTGAGFFLKAAQRAGWQVHGVEISDAAAAFARGRLGLDVVKMPAEQLGFAAGSFDVVVMYEVIEHLFEPRQVLQDVQRVLRPGGVLMISTPNVNAFSRFALGNSWAVLSPGEHLYYFTHATLNAILQAAGFREAQFHHGLPGWGAFEAMNPNYTHAPHGLRARLYHWFVVWLGPFTYRWVLSRDKGDTLLCIAHK